MFQTDVEFKIKNGYQWSLPSSLIKQQAVTGVYSLHLNIGLTTYSAIPPPIPPPSHISIICKLNNRLCLQFLVLHIPSFEFLTGTQCFILLLFVNSLYSAKTLKGYH
jgi:hypothetical protein